MIDSHIMNARSEHKNTDSESGEPQFPRRLLLKATIAAAAGLGTVTALQALLRQRQKGSKEDAKQSPAEQFFQDFPLHIPGAASVEKLPVQDSKHCLIHIRQIHLVEGRELDPEEILQRVRRAQGDIYVILSSLIEHQSLQEVYSEAEDATTVSMARVIDLLRGIAKAAEGLESFQTNFAQLTSMEIELIKKRLENDAGIRQKFPNDTEATNYRTSLRKRIAELELRLPQDIARDEEDRRLKKELQEKRKVREQEETEDYKYSAVERLMAEGRLKLRATETMEANFRAQAAAGEGRLDSPEVLDDREDLLLSFISENKDAVAYSVYGARHSWQDNIVRWNHDHPEDKFCLIVITPVSIAEEEKKKAEETSP